MPRRSRYKREEDKPLSSINFGYNVELERNKKAWEANNAMLPDDAFADDVVEEDTGHYYHRETHVAGGWSSLGEYEKSSTEGH
jgi:hypothetical protein